MPRSWTPEDIAALIDGSLTGAEAEAVARAIDTDPDARAEAERLRRLNALLRTAYETPAGAPVPAPIAAALFGGEGRVAPLRRRRIWLPAAAAAAVALAVGLGLYVRLGGPGMGSGGALDIALGEVPAGGALHLALESLPSGEAAPGGVRPMLTFLNRAGRPCREFEIDGTEHDPATLGVACRTEAGRWQVEAVAAAPEARPAMDGYAPAAGLATDRVSEALDALGAGPALKPDEEAALMRSGWSQPRQP